MKIKVIKSLAEYHDALEQVEELMLMDPETDTEESDRLEIIAVLIEDYERKNYKIDLPDPVSAIEFRMEEQGLRQRDLVPMIGSRSRVSEILARKRPLTIPMIRALSEGLGIPVEVLVQASEPSIHSKEEPEIAWDRFPFREMQKRGWIEKVVNATPEAVENLVSDFLRRAGDVSKMSPVFRRRIRGLGQSGNSVSTNYAIAAWIARIIQLSSNDPPAVSFRVNSINEELLRSLACLSRYPDGPVRAVDKLRTLGVNVVVEPALPSTLLDGAAVLDEKMRPVIGLTLRFDRVDYFWFTLLHEIAHVWKHLNVAGEAIVDRIEGVSNSDADSIEEEANRIATDALIPRDLWKRSVVSVQPNQKEIREFAEVVGVHPAIVAGRIRHESGNYRRFSKLVGQGEVRKLFN